MRVVLLGPYPPPHGGVQTHIAALRTRVLERGDECHVIGLTRHRDSKDANVFYPTSALGVMRMLWTSGYDVIHLHVGGNLSSRLLGLAFFCTLVRGARTVFTVLNAAAMTYVAAFITSVLTLLYFLMRSGLFGGRR